MLGTLLIVGVVLLGGWCFFMGPCKGWLNQLTSGGSSSSGGGSSSDFNAKVKRLMDETDFDKELKAAMNSKTVQKMSPEEQWRVGQNIGKKYKSTFDSYYGRVRLAI